MQIFVTTNKGRVLTLDNVEGDHLVEKVREKLHQQAQLAGIPGGLRPSLQRLFFTDPVDGTIHELRDGTRMSAYNIALESMLTLGMRAPPKPVKLDVGGERLTTCLSTLLRVRGSRLCTLFEGLVQAGSELPEGDPGAAYVELPVDKDRFVLDRDGKSFRFILAFLRDHDADDTANEPQPEPQEEAEEPPAHLVSLRQELEGLKLTALKRRAAATGVDPRALWAADDAVDIKAAVIELILNTVTPPGLLLPDTKEDLQLLEREAEWFGIVELAAACRQKIKREHQATLRDREVLRSLLAAQCPEGLDEAQRDAVVDEVEQLCDGAFSVRGLREVHQRIADQTMLRELAQRAHQAVQLREAHGVSQDAARKLVTDWSGQYGTAGHMACISEPEAERLGLQPRDIDAIKNTRSIAGSELAAPEHHAQLIEWLPQAQPQFELLFRAACDGYGSADFHRCCDNKGPTLMIVKSRGGFVFGGYADRAWQGGSGSYCGSPQAFLFGLHTNKGQGPIKLALGGQHDNGASNAVHHRSSYGPTFGGGHDLKIGDNPNGSASSYANLGHTYANPPGGQYGQPSSKEFFAEAHQFHVADYEVFSVR